MLHTTFEGLIVEYEKVHFGRFVLYFNGKYSGLCQGKAE